ncbi:hypothetical protein PAF04_06145 [Pseudomonas aeruginosa]|uniref:hypothetical protein n=1 Tax=Pseudomonas aeruginosa TaxID=287 RepID=UPI0034A416D8
MYISPEDIAFYGVLIAIVILLLRALGLNIIIGTWVILIRKFRRPRRVAIFISLVYLAIQGGFLLWSLLQIQVRRARFSIVWFVLVIGFFLIRLLF